MKRKRARHLLTYLLCACLLVSLLNGCGSNDSDNDGRGDIVEDQTPTTVETVNAEDFYGCWKYTDLEDWVCRGHPAYGDPAAENRHVQIYRIHPTEEKAVQARRTCVCPLSLRYGLEQRRLLCVRLLREPRQGGHLPGRPHVPPGTVRERLLPKAGGL